MKWATQRKLRKPDDVKFYWFRLTETQQKSLLQNSAGDLIDPDLKRKYNLKTCTNGNIVYTYEEEEYTAKSGKKMTRKINQKEFCRVMACSTFYNDKGRGYFDNEYKGEYICILDEMNREKAEKNNFDIVYAFVNQLENVLRSTKTKVRIIMIGNTLEEASDLLSALNFIPDGFGRYKLKRKLAVVDYIKPNEKYIERRKEATANLMMGHASTFTNEIELDRSLICSKRERRRPTSVIKFTKTPAEWFTVWDGNIIAPYNNEQVPDIPMTRYLDAIYNDDLKNAVFQQFDSRCFKFTTLACFKRFQKQLGLIKKK